MSTNKNKWEQSIKYQKLQNICQFERGVCHDLYLFYTKFINFSWLPSYAYVQHRLHVWQIRFQMLPSMTDMSVSLVNKRLLSRPCSFCKCTIQFLKCACFQCKQRYSFCTFDVHFISLSIPGFVKSCTMRNIKSVLQVWKTYSLSEDYLSTLGICNPICIS